MSAKAENSEEPEKYGAVETYTFYDAGSDYFMAGGIYWDSDAEEWESIHAPDDAMNQSSFELVEPSEEVQERWDTRQKAKKAAREKFKDLFDSIKHGSECPVCGGEMYRVSNPPECYADKDNLMFCGDCSTNTWYGQGMIGNFWVTVANGINWDLGIPEDSVLLKDSTGKDCSVRYKRGPDYYGEAIKEFKDGLNDLKEKVNA